MKHMKFYAMVTVVLAALMFTQYAVAEAKTNQSIIFQFSSVENPQPDDGQEDTDGGDDQCELIFPFCEAN